MKIKNKKISKKDWYLKKIKTYLEDYIKYEEDEEISLEKYLEYKNHRQKLIDYIKTDLIQNLSDDLTCINGVGGKQDEQIGMIEFINMFSDLNLKVEDFEIEREKPVGKFADYIWKIAYIFRDERYEYLSDLFTDFIDENAEKILDEVKDE